MKRIIPPNPIDDWLNQTYYASDLFYFDNWTFVHFTFGLLLGYFLIKKLRVKNPVTAAFGIIVLYEVFEYYLGSLFFNPELLIDTVWDIIIGMTAFSIAMFFLNKKTKEPESREEPLITPEK